MTNGPNHGLEISAQEAARLLDHGTLLVDIRSVGLRSAGFATGAITMPADQIASSIPGDSASVLVMCVRGLSSLEAVQALHEAGRTEFISIAGGFEAWKKAGLPCTWPDGFNAEDSERYARHLAMPQVGASGQKRLAGSRVLLIGLGGLGSPAALYLAAAGVGTLGLLDNDRVERSNLQRQIIHSDQRLGQPKVESAAETLANLNPGTKLKLLPQRLDDGNAAELLKGWDVVLDGSDNFETRYAVNRACVALGIPLVYGAVMRFQGQVSVFWPGSSATRPGPCLRCFQPQQPTSDAAPSCAEAGVLGVLPGIIGTLQATETLKLLLGIGESLAGRLLMVDALSMQFHNLAVARVPDCPDCA